MEILNIYPNPERSEWAALTERCTRREEEITRQVASILDEVRTGGDRALRDITRRIEGRDCETFEVPADVRRAAAALIPEALKEALATAKANIEAFHRAQLPPEVSVEPMPGVRCVQRALPIRRVGLYIPGGKALREKVAGHLGSTDYRALAPGMRATFVKVVNQDLAPVLPRISAETLLVFGRNDQETPLWMGEALRDGIRGSALVVLENAGHFAYLEQCAAFLRIMDAFFFPEGKEAR